MTTIAIKDIEKASYLIELAESEANLTRGGWLPIVAAAWLGYSIGKEIAIQTR